MGLSGRRSSRAAFVVLLGLTLGAVLPGCGGGRTVRHRRTEIVKPAPRLRPRSAGYRWLVPASGPAPGIAAENRHPGTRAWRLPGPAVDVGGLAHGAVTGYVAEEAVRPGQAERIYVSAPGSRSVAIRIFRMGWYGGRGGREVLVAHRLGVVPQPPCVHRSHTGLTECRWHPTLSFRIPSALPTGVYIVKLSSRSGASDCMFVVRASTAEPLLAQLPTSTYEAYNAWGGDSLYPGGADRVGLTRTTQGVEVSYRRPYDSVTGAGQFFARDVAMVRFLERYGYPVSYTTSESVDADPGQLAGHRALIDFGHSEYWSARQERGFARALARGTSLLFFGSDTLAWRVRYAKGSPAGGGEKIDSTIVAYKQFTALARSRSDRAGTFTDRGAGLSGSAYLGCITPRLREPGPPAYRYYSWSPAPGRQPSWLFAGTGASAGTRIPGIVGYELDARTKSTPVGTQLVGSGSAPCMARPDPGEARLGSGGAGLAETTLYRAPSGAIVFDSGTLGWELGLEPVPSASPDAPRAPDPRVVAITRNLLRRALRSRSRA